MLLFFFYFADPVQKVSLSCSNLSKSVGKFPFYVAGGGYLCMQGNKCYSTSTFIQCNSMSEDLHTVVKM